MRQKMWTRIHLQHSLFYAYLQRKLTVSFTLSAFSAQILFLTVERININNGGMSNKETNILPLKFNTTRLLHNA